MQFHDAYIVKPGDSLSTIGRKKGYSNPGPIIAYQPNNKRFKNRSPNLIRTGEAFLIPWHPALLNKFIATTEDLIEQVGKTAEALIER